MAAKSLIKMMNVEIVSDLTCPFCWIGKKRLEASMEKQKLENNMEFHVKWLPFQLRREAPPEGMPVPVQYTDPVRLAQIRQLGEEVGLELNFSYACLPNTTLAHALIEFAGLKDDGTKQSDVAEMLFKTHFTDGKMLSEEALVNIGQQAGFDGEEVRAYITSKDNQAAIQDKCMRNSIKVSKSGGGVPMYIFNGQPMFSGAQSEAVFTRMLTVAAERFPLPQTSKKA